MMFSNNIKALEFGLTRRKIKIYFLSYFLEKIFIEQITVRPEQSSLWNFRSTYLHIIDEEIELSCK